MKKSTCFLLSSLIFSLLAFVQVYGQGTMLLREPTISQDKIVFVYANDLWVTSTNGGDAIRLTSSEGAETSPHLSPDGQWVAFTGQYDGNTDVYVVSVKGGQPLRLTWHPGRDIVTGWMPDGKNVLFSSGREGVPTKESKFYQISASGGNETPLEIPRGVLGELSANGSHIAYQMISFWDPEWRNYRGGQAKPIWIVDMKNYSLQTTEQTDNERHTNPVWLGGVVYYLSEKDYANNIWSYNPATKETKQHSFHSDFDVKSLDAGNGKIVYEQGGHLHVLDPTNNNTTKLNIDVRGDFHHSRERWAIVRGSNLINASLSPSGKRAIFEFRGEVLTVPKKNGDWRNITNSSDEADRYPIWSPDGEKIAWFSDKGGEYQLMVSDQLGMEKAKSYKLPNPTFYFRPDWSPDGKYIAFTDTDYNLWHIDLASGKTTKVDTERYAHPNRSMNPVWSPDSKWITYSRLLDNQFKVIKAYNVESKKTYELTDGMSDSFSPVWDESGKYLYFLGSTSFGLNTGWLDMSSYDITTTYALYMIVLSKDDPSPLLPTSDEEENKSKEDKKEDKAQDASVKIDIEGINQRIIALDIPERTYTGLLKGPKNHIFYMERAPNARGLTLHRYSLKDKKATELSKAIASAEVSHDRKSLLYQKGGSWSIASSTSSSLGKGDSKLNLSNIRVKISPQEEWKQIFREGWRYQRDFLYVNNTHGAPWDDVYKWYSPWVEHVQHRSDLNYLVDILGGEISVGH
ncbi:MAG: protease, partial [Bacteroidota bacterium]